jgi:ABC-2 type transport system permease protein
MCTFVPIRKAFQIARLTFQEYFTYRLNFILWRFRSFVLFFSLLVFWLAIYKDRIELLGYQKAQMLIYVVGIAFLRSIILASRSADLAGQIRNGELTKTIMLPINMLSFWFSRDLVDKALNIFFGILEISLAITILKLPFYFPHQIQSYFYFIILVVLAFFLYFCLNFFISILAFWTEEIWATRWLFGIVFLEFFAGALFPIDILPTWLQKIIYLTPFPYLIYFPLKVWLEQLSTGAILKSILVCACWLGLFYWLVKALWQKGVKNYEAYGG